MSRADYVFDVIILGPLNEDGLPEFGIRKNGIIAKDESAAKMKAVKFAREAGDKIDLDKVEFVVTRPFVKDCAPITLWPTPVPYYVPTTPTMPWRPCYPEEPAPVWCSTGPVFASGYLTADNHVTVGSTDG